MKKSINLSIPTHCNEKWENFTKTTQGGFCGSCNKTVIDFKHASDEEIFEFFKTKPVHACGRFRADQLKTYTFSKSLATINPGFALLKAGLLSLVLLLLSRPTSAQTKPEPDKKEILDQQATSTIADANEGRMFKGIVLSEEDDSPLPGVNILLKGTQVGTITESDGRFEFPQELKEGDVLIFTFIGLLPVEYRIPKESKTPAEIKMIYMELDITGEVAVTELYSEPSGIRKVWSKVKAIF